MTLIGHRREGDAADGLEGVLVAGENASGNQQNLLVNSSGQMSVSISSGQYVSGFGSSTPLSAKTTFDTGVVDLSGLDVHYVITELKSNTDGFLQVFFYDDASGTSLLRTFSRPYDSTEGFVVVGSVLTRPYVRYVYTNGGAAQSSFHLATRVLKESIGGQVLGLNDFIPNNIIVPVTRSVPVSKNSLGEFVNVDSTESNQKIKLLTGDPIDHSFQGDILKELKLMNKHLSLLTGLDITTDEI